VPAEEVRRQINERFGSQRRLFVFLNHEVRDSVDRIVGRWFGMTYIQVLVAVVVAILGIVNTLTVSIADRRRELGVLRALGGLRGADPEDHLDGVPRHRRHWLDSGPGRRRHQPLL
jgi:putative ABC transport system permease protein